MIKSIWSDKKRFINEVQKIYKALDASILRLELLFVTIANHHETLISAHAITVCLISKFLKQQVVVLVC